jgi:hypothetical protein
LPLQAFEPRTVQAIAYTDYATAAHRFRYLCWTSLRYQCSQFIVPTKCTLLFTFGCYIYRSDTFR